MTAETIQTTAGPGTLVPGPARTILAAAEAAVRAAQERAEREARDKAARAAVDAADAAAWFVKEKIGDIAAQLHKPEVWTGYPPIRAEDSGTGFPVVASAVAWLGSGAEDGSGIWLHFEHRQRHAGVSGHLTVVSRCVCGRHREREVGDVYALAAGLAQALTRAVECDRACTPYEHELEAARADD
ncbi:hypothetical protein [Streptodolium elevatio]